MRRFLLLIFFSVLFFGCDNEKSAEETLREFISYRFQKDQSKDQILSFVTGELHSKISSMNAQDMEKFVNSNTLVKKKLKIVLENCNETQCFITYTLAYDKILDDSSRYQMETKKIAELTKLDSIWKISEVTEIKSFMEATTPIEVIIP